MSFNPCGNGPGGILEDNDECDDLRSNIGRVITVFTQSGGCSGMGFTGLLVKVEHGFIKLITSLPSAPRHPFGFQGGHNFNNWDDCHNSRFGTVIVIPIRKIVSYVFNEV